MSCLSPSAILSSYTVNSPQNGTDVLLYQYEDENKFCSEDTVLECAAYLNQELETLGVSPVVGQDEPTVVELLNTLYALLQYNRGTAKKMDDITNSLLRTRSNLTLQTEAAFRLGVEKESLLKSLSLQKEAERQLTERNRSLSMKLKIEKEEVRRLQQCQSYEEQKYIHKVKKKDREYMRLKDRLGELVLNKSQERKIGIKLLNTLQKYRKTWNSSSKSSEDMYKLLVAHYDEREKELILENSSLRESLQNMEKELATLLNERVINSDCLKPTTQQLCLQEGEDEIRIDTAVDPLMDSGSFRMPFDMTREDIERSLREKYQKLRDHISLLKERNLVKEETHVNTGPSSHTESDSHSDQSDDDDERKLDGYEAEIEELMKQLSNYEEIIAQQEELIRENLKKAKNTSHRERGISIMSPSHVLRKVEDLDKKEQRIHEREQLIIENEKKLMEATHTLDRERRDFEDQKGKFYKQQFLESSIFVTPNRAATGPTQLNSFFAGLSSTPFPPSITRSTRPSSLNQQQQQQPNTKSSTSSSFSTAFSDTPNKENILFGSPVLRKSEDVSLSSDDGQRVINE